MNIIFFRTGAQKIMGAQKLRRGRDASASLRHPQMAPGFELRAWDRQTDRQTDCSTAQCPLQATHDKNCIVPLQPLNDAALAEGPRDAPCQLNSK